jgi:hypothetical protein
MIHEIKIPYPGTGMFCQLLTYQSKAGFGLCTCHGQDDNVIIVPKIRRFHHLFHERITSVATTNDEQASGCVFALRL